MKDILKNCLLGFAALLVVGLSVGLIVQSQDQDNNIQIDSKPQTPAKQHYKKIDFSKVTPTGEILNCDTLLTLMNDGSDYFVSCSTCEYIDPQSERLWIGKNDSEPGGFSLTLNDKYSFNTVKVVALDEYGHGTNYKINNSGEIIYDTSEICEKEINFDEDQKKLEFNFTRGCLCLYSIELWKA